MRRMRWMKAAKTDGVNATYSPLNKMIDSWRRWVAVAIGCRDLYLLRMPHTGRLVSAERWCHCWWSRNIIFTSFSANKSHHIHRSNELWLLITYPWITVIGSALRRFCNSFIQLSKLRLSQSFKFPNNLNITYSFHSANWITFQPRAILSCGSSRLVFGFNSLQNYSWTPTLC